MKTKSSPFATSRILLMVVSCLITLTACITQEDKQGVTPQITYGKNRFTVEIDGDDREFYVHVPSGYSNGSHLPVVIMFHGTSGDGERFYNISGWKEVGETENILTVFPSSWRYCIIDEGQVKNTTKWNIFPTSRWTYCQGEVPKDDIKFMRTMIADLENRYDIDEKRVYVTGFSNGGQFASRCAIELSDMLAAAVSNAGFFPMDTIFTPRRILPVICQLGNEDPLFTELAGISAFPMDMEQLFTDYPAFQRIVDTYLHSFQLSSNYTSHGNPNQYIWRNYTGDGSNPDNLFRFVMVKGLKHNYPNGNNHPMMGAEVHWGWIQQFSLP